MADKYTVTSAAEKLGCATATIRRHRARLMLGEQINARLWLLTAKEVEALRAVIPGKPGPRPKVF